MRDVGVPVHGGVGDRVSVADQELTHREVVVDHAERLDPDPASSLGLLVVGCHAAGEEAEAEPADAADDVGLLVHEPAHDLCALDRRVREERRPVGEEHEDGVRLDQEPAGCDLEHRRRAQRVDAAVLLGEHVAAEDVDRNAIVVALCLREQQAHLVAVGGGPVVVQAEAVRRGLGNGSPSPRTAPSDSS